MSRIATFASVDAAPSAARSSLAAVERQLGSVPNLFRLVANSPAALAGYLGLSGALAGGTLPAATRERIALAIAEWNACDYCLAAHTYLGTTVAGLEATEIDANRHGRSLDAKADAAVRFAVEVIERRGRVDDDALSTVKAAGYDEGQVVEIVAHVALNVFTNFVNGVGRTDIDFPQVEALVDTRRAA